MPRDPERVIEDYLERVKVYLPIGSEDILTEIRTHILDSAEQIGDGKVTEGSVIMAMERLGDPQRLANEYAGTGEKLGPVPAVYVQPLFRILLTLLAVGIALIVGFNVVAVAFEAYFEFGFLPYSAILWVGLNILAVISIIAIISLYVDRDRWMTERTTLETVFGAGNEGFKPKGRLDAAGEAFFGIFLVLLLMLPPILAALKPGIIPLILVGVILLLAGTVKGALFYKFGENSLNLLFEALLCIGWVFLAVLLAGFPYPMDVIYYNTNGVWQSISVTNLASIVPIEAFDITIVFVAGWSIFIFILVVTNVWKTLVAFAKIALYLKDDKGWWWQGGWGKPKYKRSRWYKWFFSKTEDGQSDSAVYQDGHQE